MKKRNKNKTALPFILLFLVLVISIGGLILVQSLRKDAINQPAEYTNQDEIPRVTVEEAWQAVQRGEAVLMDTRSEAQFEMQHAAGAINLPIDQIDTQMATLDPETWYITYCT